MYGFLTGAKERIGRIFQNRDFLLTHKVPFQHDDHYIHMSDFILGLLNYYNKQNNTYDQVIQYSNSDMAFVDSLIENSEYSNSKLIGLCPCSADEPKDWTVKETANFIDLVNNNTDYKVVLVGNKSGQLFSEKIRETGITNYLDLTSKTNVTQLIALVSKFYKLVSVDTGTAHIAYALKIPSVTLFFWDNFKRWGPKNQDINKIIFNPSGIKASDVFDLMFACPELKTSLYK
jgi:ADP-heptose:LPS heptosyltransferase